MCHWLSNKFRFKESRFHAYDWETSQKSEKKAKENISSDYYYLSQRLKNSSFLEMYPLWLAGAEARACDIQAVTTAYEVYFSDTEQIAFDLSRKNAASNLQGLKKTLFIFFHIFFHP